jgi:inward rectifier potassium channel
MFGIAAIAVMIPRVFEGQTAGFAIAYGGVRLARVALYTRTYLQLERAREMTGLYAIGFGLGASLWLGSAFVGAPWVFLLWALAMAIDFAVPLNRRSRELAGRYPPDVLHMSERFGIMTLIVLGESFVKVLTDLAERGADWSSALMGGQMLLVVCSLWWIYFDDVAGSRIKPKPLAPFIWVYTHLPLALAVTAVGVGVKKAVALDPWSTPDAKYRWLLAGTLALALVAVGVIDSVTARRQAELSDRARVNTRFASAALALLLAPAGAFLPSWVFGAALAALSVAQVVFDLSMAPLAAEHDHEAQVVFDRAHSARPVALAAPEPRPPSFKDVSEAVRKGTPVELRRDLYFYFMEGSWTRLFMALLVLYVVTNFVFASLYLLEPGAVAGARPGSFLDSFFFSVQTMSTIGYGAMSPGSTWAHVLVTIEAAVGLLGIALATGVMFAKASRPKASVLFSNVAVVTRLHGRSVLMFRIGNARGNEVVEATVRVAVLKNDRSPEGQRFRRFYDLGLERQSTPVFALTWMVMHPIDEQSPLYGIDPDNAGERMVSIVATLTGFDGTYAQTIHARHVYQPANLRFGHRFADVVSSLEDGRLMVDYERFHDTEAEAG